MWRPLLKINIGKQERVAGSAAGRLHTNHRDASLPPCCAAARCSAFIPPMHGGLLGVTPPLSFHC